MAPTLGASNTTALIIPKTNLTTQLEAVRALQQGSHQQPTLRQQLHASECSLSRTLSNATSKA